MIYKCDCCGFTADFGDPEAAFAMGWDAPPHFTGYVACNLCPASYQFSPQGWARHASIHERWEREGRPAEYSQETCVAEEDRIPQETLDKMHQIVIEEGPTAETILKLRRMVLGDDDA